MMQPLNKAVMNFVAILWIFTNLWISVPYADNSTPTYTLQVAIIIINPIIFALMAWYGSKNKMISPLIYSIAVILSWLVGPAIFSVFRWGVDTFFRFLFDKRSILFWIYLFACIAIYYFTSAIAKRRLKNS